MKVEPVEMRTVLGTAQNHCIDFVKGIACICVVFMHCEFPGRLGILVQCVSRFCVPFFFMVAGYFSFYNGFATQEEKKQRAFRKLKRLGKMILFAVILYVAYAFVGGSIPSVTAERIIDLLLFNQPVIIAAPMWFLFALFYDYVLYALIDKWELQRISYKVIPILMLLYIALAQGAHLLGVSVPNFRYRNFLIE